MADVTNGVFDQIFSQKKPCYNDLKKKLNKHQAEISFTIFVKEGLVSAEELILSMAY